MQQFARFGQQGVHLDVVARRSAQPADALNTVRAIADGIIQPNSSDALLTATFYANETDPSGAVVTVDHVGWLNGASCTATDCSGGSRIIAASGGPIKKITLTIAPHDIVSSSYPGDSFAIGAFRYSMSDQLANVSTPAPAVLLTPQPGPATLVSPASGSTLPGAAGAATAALTTRRPAL